MPGYRDGMTRRECVRLLAWVSLVSAFPGRSYASVMRYTGAESNKAVRGGGLEPREEVEIAKEINNSCCTVLHD